MLSGILSVENGSIYKAQSGCLTFSKGPSWLIGLTREHMAVAGASKYSFGSVVVKSRSRASLPCLVARSMRSTGGLQLLSNSVHHGECQQQRVGSLIPLVCGH